LLSKDYPFQGVNLEVKTATPSGVTFKAAGNRDTKSEAIVGDIEAKWSDRKHGLTVTETWTTSNILRTNVELENQIAKGLKLDVNTQLFPDKGAKSAIFNAAYKQSGFHTRASLDLFKVSAVEFYFTSTSFLMDNFVCLGSHLHRRHCSRS
jgi:voltage-dependent anion channel protein 2